jgi:hypothetical protein
MSAIIRNGVLLLCAVLSTGLVAEAQQKTASTYTTDVDLAITYVAERAKVPSVDRWIVESRPQGMQWGQL